MLFLCRSRSCSVAQPSPFLSLSHLCVVPAVVVVGDHAPLQPWPGDRVQPHPPSAPATEAPARALALFHSDSQITRIPRPLPLRRPDPLEFAEHRICPGRGPCPRIRPGEIIFFIVSVGEAGSHLMYLSFYLRWVSSVLDLHVSWQFQVCSLYSFGTADLAAWLDPDVYHLC
ncbi:hypothetical protein VPH35_054837 [Triticum aestivum]